MVCNSKETDPDINIPAVLLPKEARAVLQRHLTHGQVPVQLYAPDRPLVDTVEAFLWLMAVGTILGASYRSSRSAWEADIEQEKLLKDGHQVLPNPEAGGSIGGEEDLQTIVIQRTVMSWDALVHGFGSDSEQACMSIYQTLMFIARVQNCVPEKWTTSANWNWRVDPLIGEKLAADLKGHVKLEDAGFDWKILGPNVQEVDYMARGLRSGRLCLLWSEVLKQAAGSYACVAESAARFTSGRAKEELLRVISMQEEQGNSLEFYKTDQEHAVADLASGQHRGKSIQVWSSLLHQSVAGHRLGGKPNFKRRGMSRTGSGLGHKHISCYVHWAFECCLCKAELQQQPGGRNRTDMTPSSTSGFGRLL